MQKFNLLDGTILKVPDHHPTRKQLNASAKKGAAWITNLLGENWVNLINLEELDMSSYMNDVLGQLAFLILPDVEGADYFDVIQSDLLEYKQEISLGFAPPVGSPSSFSYMILTDVWVRLITKLREDYGNRLQDSVQP